MASARPPPSDSPCRTTGVRSTRRSGSGPGCGWLGIRSIPTYVGDLECNGFAKRFIRTLKEECIHLHDFESLEEAKK